MPTAESSPVAAFQAVLARLVPGDEDFAVQLVDALWQAAAAAGASDVHLAPGPDGLTIRWRLDGVLHPLAVVPASVAPNVIARLKVLAGLLTYRTDVPQEGRCRDTPLSEVRISTFPTIHGEQAVARLFGAAGRFDRLASLQLPTAVAEALAGTLRETSGMVVLAGPAGSGKSTTLYACLREIVHVSSGGRSIASLEDPVEVVVQGVAQTQIDPGGGFGLAEAIKFILRQDPEVLMLGEIRDQGTAEMAFQAALSGHLLLTSFHAGSVAAALGRLLEMGVPPYAITSSLLAIVCQRLLRRLCECSRPATNDELLGLPVSTARVETGCQCCQHTGYRGRIVIAEMCTEFSGDLGRAILERADTRRLAEAASGRGRSGLWDEALRAVEEGRTSPSDLRRVLGLRSV